MLRTTSAILLLLALAFAAPAAAQDGVTVPDLRGLNVPAAAALLNQNGLRLGAQSVEPWTEASGLPQNVISGQSVAPGAAAPSGSAVDVTLLSSPNAALIYDENDLTLVNTSGAPLDISGVLLNANGGAARFNAARWTGVLDVGDCAQVWSIVRTAPKDVEGCDTMRWLTTNNPAEHAWTALNNVAAFTVEQGGVVRATCPAAPAGSAPLRCDVYIAGGSAVSDSTPFVYFVYTVDRFAAINPTTDQWMALAQTPLFNFNPNLTQQGLGINLGDATLYGSPNTVADIARLAPGQCLLLTNSSPTDPNPPQPCVVIARLAVDPQVIFWAAAFEVESVSDGIRRRCPAATLDRLTICMLPR